MIFSVWKWCSDLLRLASPSYSLSLHDLYPSCIQALNLHILPVIPKRGKWLKPPISGLKLNVDGSAIDLNSAGGGCIRDSAGVIVLAFSCWSGK